MKKKKKKKKSLSKHQTQHVALQSVTNTFFYKMTKIRLHKDIMI